jgi:translation initiation factor IF-3
MKVVATIKRIKPIQTVGANNFKLQEIHVTTEEQYSQTLAIQFVQDSTKLLDNFKEGDKVSIDINLRGREVIKEGQEPAVFNSINGWRIEKAV